MDFEFKRQYNVDDLIRIMKILRGPEGCPWDKEQDHMSIRKNLIEECYETVEAIDCADPVLLREELGDLLLQIVFHSQMEAESGRFDFNDVADEICKKLITRHPHIFSDTVVSGSEQVLDNWEQIKKVSKGQALASQTLDAVPKQLPALMRAQKCQARAAKAGFDYSELSQALQDLKSEIAELEAEIEAKDRLKALEELGDLMFSCVNIARFLKGDAEETLTFSTEKFIKRFRQVEDLALNYGIDLKAAGMDELDNLWKQIKNM